MVRSLHERGSSPYAIRPPLPTQPLPKAFDVAKSPYTETDGEKQVSNSATNSEAKSRSNGAGTLEENIADAAFTEQETEKEKLSVYAQRLEVAILQELQQALQEMEGEVNSDVGSSAANGNESQKAEDDDHDMLPDVADD